MQLRLYLCAMQQFYAHGKLLISGEYLVLKGAMALAIPTKFGQRMEVSDDASGENILHWQSFDVNNQIWAEVIFSKTDLLPFRGSVKNIDDKTLNTLQKNTRCNKNKTQQFFT
ncbi:MAG: hypothetical protein IPL12_17990 [Bacteroidetes bacterium]|nr:hypothetical protein [Bacteroidota bacterium]